MSPDRPTGTGYLLGGTGFYLGSGRRWVMGDGITDNVALAAAGAEFLEHLRAREALHVLESVGGHRVANAAVVDGENSLLFIRGRIRVLITSVSGSSREIRTDGSSAWSEHRLDDDVAIVSIHDGVTAAPERDAAAPATTGVGGLIVRLRPTEFDAPALLSSGRPQSTPPPPPIEAVLDDTRPRQGWADEAAAVDPPGQGPTSAELIDELPWLTQKRPTPTVELPGAALALGPPTDSSTGLSNSPARRRSVRFALLAGALATAVAAGVGLWASGLLSSGSSPRAAAAPHVQTPKPSPTPSPTPIPTPSPTPAPPMAGPLTLKWTAVASGDGLTENISLAAGSPERPQPGLTHDGVALNTSCPIDSATDAVIPARLDVTNTTTGSSFRLAARLVFDPGWRGAAAEAQYAQGLQCVANSEVGLVARNPAAPGQTQSLNLFFVLHGYFGAEPSAAATTLASARLVVSLVNNSGPGVPPPVTTFKVTSLTGPGARGFVIPLAGA